MTITKDKQSEQTKMQLYYIYIEQSGIPYLKVGLTRDEHKKMDIQVISKETNSQAKGISLLMQKVEICWAHQSQT